MKFIDKDQRLDFMGKRKISVMFSAIILLVSIVSMGIQGLNFGIDFTGGTLIEVGYTESADLEEIRGALQAKGFKNPVVQHFGSTKEVLIRLAPREDMSNSELSDAAFAALNSEGMSKAELRRVEFVGPQVGEQLTEDGGLAMIYALLGILVYVAMRFEYRFAFGSVIALMHDVVITLGVFSVFQIDFDLTILAAILAVIGYSLNDTIVVFDRIRENFRSVRTGTPVEIVNGALNQTLSRTLVTSLTTLLVLVALYFLGGAIIHGFALALIVGVVIGTYSSIYVASTSVLSMGITREDMLVVEIEREGDGDVV